MTIGDFKFVFYCSVIGADVGVVNHHFQVSECGRDISQQSGSVWSTHRKHRVPRVGTVVNNCMQCKTLSGYLYATTAKCIGNSICYLCVIWGS